MKSCIKTILIITLLCISFMLLAPKIESASSDYEIVLKAYKVDESYLDVPEDLGILWAEDFQTGALDDKLLSRDAELKEGDVIAVGIAVKFKGSVSPYASRFQIVYSYDETIFDVLEVPIEDSANEDSASGGFPTRYWEIIGTVANGLSNTDFGDGATTASRRSPFSSKNENETPVAFNFYRVKTGITPGKEIKFEKVNDPYIFAETLISDSEGNSYDLDMVVYNDQLKVYEEVALPSDDTTLSSLTVKNINKTTNYILDPVFVGSTETDINENQALEYTVIVPSNIDQVVINATANEPKASLSLTSGEITVPLGLPGSTTTETFMVTPEPGSSASVAQYKITIKRLDNSTSLKSISLTNVTGFVFNESTKEYNLTVPYQTTNTTVTATLPDSSKATIKSGTGAWDLTNYGSTVNTKIIRVEAEDCKYDNVAVPGNTCTFEEYKINITRTSPDNDSSLSSLEVKNNSTGSIIYDLDKTFNPGTLSYTVTVPYETNTVYIEGTANSLLHKNITGTGNVTLTGNTTVQNITVTAEDDTTTTYIVTINKQISNNANLTGITVNGTSVNNFDKDTQTYTLTDVNGMVNSLTVNYTKENQYSTVTVTGNTSLIDGNNTITLTVTAQDGVTTKEYKLNVYRKSNNANLQALTVASNPQGTLNPSSFNVNTKTYKYTYDEKVTTITVNGILENNKATIEGNRDYDPKTETKAVLKITSEDGTKNTYTINFERRKSSDTTLKSLTVMNGTEEITLSPTLNGTDTTYTATVEYDVKNVTVSAVPNSDVASITAGNGSWTLSNTGTSINTRIITVESETGTTKNYTIKITRKESDNNFLSDLKINGTTIADFDKTNTTYRIDPAKSTTNQLAITYTLENSDATATIVTGTNNLVTGENTVIIRVTAQNGDIRDYEINVKKLSGNANLAALNLTSNPSGTLTPALNDTTTVYTYKYDRTVTDINVTATAKENGTVTGGGSYNPSVTKSVTLTVTAEDSDITKTYTINFEQILESENELSSLSVTNTNNGTAYTLTPSFNSSITTYSVTVPSDVEKVTIAGTPKGNYTKNITGLGETALQSGSNTKTVTVTAEDDSTKTYTLNITREINSNATLTEITIDGNPLPGFTPENPTYDLGSVDYEIDKINLSATGVTGTTLAGIGEKNLTVGDNTFEIKVTADSGATGTYTIKVRRKSNDSTIASISSSVGTVRNTGTNEYTIDVPSGTTEISLTPTLNHKDASVIAPSNLNNIDITGLSEIEITTSAEDTKPIYNSTYKIKINKLESTNAYLSNLTVDEGILTPSFIKTTNKYSVTVDSNIEKINITATKEDTLATISGNVGEQNLSYGENIFTITVTAENGTTNDYEITVTRTKKNISTLSEITIDGTEIPNFDPSQETYNITVPEGTTEIEIGAITTDSDATVEGVGPHTISGNTETIILNVKAQDGTTKTYTIVVKKADPSSVYLDSLSVDNFNITPSFDKDTLEYMIEGLTETTDSLTINASTSTPDATITYQLNSNEVGNNHIIDITNTERGYINVIITADGVSKTYKLSFTKTTSGLNKITSGKKDDGITDIHTIDEDYILTGRPELLISDFKKEFINDYAELHIFDSEGNELADTEIIKTALIIKLIRNSSELDSKEIVVKADVKSDGNIDLVDANRIVNHYLRTDILERSYFKAGDINKDDEVDLIDANMIVNHYLGSPLITW